MGIDDPVLLDSDAFGNLSGSCVAGENASNIVRQRNRRDCALRRRVNLGLPFTPTRNRSELGDRSAGKTAEDQVVTWPSAKKHKTTSSLPTDAGQLLIGDDVDDFELLGVEGRIGAEGQLAEIALLERDQELLVFFAQPIEHGGIDDDAKLEV